MSVVYCDLKKNYDKRSILRSNLTPILLRSIMVCNAIAKAKIGKQRATERKNRADRNRRQKAQLLLPFSSPPPPPGKRLHLILITPPPSVPRRASSPSTRFPNPGAAFHHRLTARRHTPPRARTRVGDARSTPCRRLYPGI